MIQQHPQHDGLTSQEVLESRQKHGENVLTPPKRPSMWRLYLEKFSDPVIRILLVAAFFSLIIAVWENEYIETIGIFFAIFLATGIGFYFEYDAARKFDLLNAVADDTLVPVRRNGQILEIPKREIVVGDIVLLNTGDEIPADGELVEAISLQINESTLTGELSVSKTTNAEHFDDEATYPSNHVLRGTTVTDGHGVVRILRVGDATEIGKVARQASQDSGEDTPLNLQLKRLAQLIGRIGFIVAGAMFVLFTTKDLYYYLSAHELAVWEDYVPVVKIILKYFMMAVTLIVVAVPEGLPMSITLSLALNMRRMLKTNNLIRKMHAGETMGAITVICTDKTGTLTQNKMQVYEYKPTDISQEMIHEAISVNTTAFLEEKDGTMVPVGNPTEGALLLWMQGQGIDYLAQRNAAEVVDQLTFSTERKYMATLVQSPLHGKRILYIKGAPEIVLRQCTLSEETRTRYEEHLYGYQQMAMRTLALAYKEVPENETDCENIVKQGDLTLMGIFAISDPVRMDVPDAVEQCYNAGIGVKIVTGDTSATAIEIARRIGLWKREDTAESQITGVDFAALTDEEALQRIKKLKVMSRARPLDKQRLVQLLQQTGEVVAVTGDGTNDAPALNHAHVGLSMGTGTSVAKEASDITLLDDSFRSIVTAVMWGRSLYKNIQRFIIFQLTINLVALASVLLSAFIGTEQPLTVTQMLWVNLIMDTFAAMALATISPDVEVMRDAPRNRSAFIITPPMMRFIFGVGITFLIALLGMLVYFHQSYGEVDGYHLTVFFTTFVMLQVWNLFNAALFGTHHSVFTHYSQIVGTLSVVWLILILQICIVTFGGALFRVEPLTLETWLYIILGTSPVFIVGEVYRGIMRWRAKK